MEPTGVAELMSLPQCFRPNFLIKLLDKLNCKKFCAVEAQFLCYAIFYNFNISTNTVC